MGDKSAIYMVKQWT